MSSTLQHQAHWEASALAFFHRQFLEYPKPFPPSTNLSGQTVVVTGSNVGLGLEATRQLLELGASYAILAVRSQSKGDAAAATLRRDFPSAKIEVWILDMASYDSIRAFASRCGSLSRLDVVILNAGLQLKEFALNDHTGHEASFQINYISAMLLAILLLPILKAKKQPGQPGRLSLVGSDTMYWSTLDPHVPLLAKIDDPKTYNSFGSYQDAKLCLAMSTYKLAENVDPEDVIVNVVNPGLCGGTDFGRGETNIAARYAFSMISRILGRSTKTGASTYIHAAVVDGPESHGSFCSDWAIKPFPELLYTKEGVELRERVWHETLQELKEDEASKIVAQLKT